MLYALIDITAISGFEQSFDLQQTNVAERTRRKFTRRTRLATARWRLWAALVSVRMSNNNQRVWGTSRSWKRLTDDVSTWRLFWVTRDLWKNWNQKIITRKCIRKFLISEFLKLIEFMYTYMIIISRLFKHLISHTSRSDEYTLMYAF